MENLVITRGTIEDASQLTELSVTTFRDTFGPANRKEDMDKYLAEEMNTGKLTEELKDSNNLFFIAWLNDTIAGYAKLRTGTAPEELKDNNAIELERIYVLKEMQGKKIGAALMNTCLTYAVSKKFDTIWLGVWENNTQAITFYKKLEFEFFGSHPFVLGDDHQTDQLMKKHL